MPLGRPPNETFDHIVVDIMEVRLGASGAMVVAPAPDYWIEGPYQVVLLHRHSDIQYHFVEFPPHSLHCRLRWSDYHLPLGFPESPSKKVESFSYVYDSRLLLGEFQSALFQERDECLSGFFNEFLCWSRYNEVVRISCETCFLRHFFLDKCFHSVQSHVSQYWASHASLWCATVGREQFPAVDIPSFQELSEDLLIHHDIIEKPLMRYVVKAPANIGIQNPRVLALPRSAFEYLFTGILTTSSDAEPVAIPVRCGFLHWV